MPKLHLSLSTRLGAALLSVLVFAGLAGVVVFAVETERDRLEQRERAKVQQRVATLASRIDAELNANVFLANGLVAYISALGSRYDDRMLAALQAVHDFGRHLRNIGVAPENRIKYVYPLAGNEAAIGLYYPDLKDQWPAVQAAIAANKTVLAGPVTLKQGGMGLISRTPVTLPDGAYWGIISLVLDLDSFWSAVGVSAEIDGIMFAVRGTDGRGVDGDVFLGDPTLFDADSIQQSIQVPGGSWAMAAFPVDGWRHDQDYLHLVESVGVLLSILIAVGAYGYQRNRMQAIESEKRLRTFIDTTREGVIVIDQSGIVQEFNAAAEDLFGYSSDEIVGQSVSQLMPAPEAEPHDGSLRNARISDFQVMARERRVMVRRKDNTKLPIEVSVGIATVGKQNFHVGLVRDITEQKAFESKLIELATTDGLTRLLNRRAFMEVAEKAFKLSRRHQHPLCLLMIDADHFKRINDTYGHQSGDDVLVGLAGLCRDFFRSTDLLARIGGEEFIALLPETDVSHAAEVSLRLLERVRALEITSEDDRKIRFTVSAGLTQISGDDNGIEDMMHRADDALYRAKEQGRDRVVIASTPG